MAERGKPKGNVEFSWLLHSRILTRVKRHLRCDRLKCSECEYVKSGLAQSVERLFYKTPRRRFRLQWFFSVFYYYYLFFYFFLLLLFSFIIVILNYCKMDYKVYIIRNNKLIYLSRMKSCLWGLSCYHNSLAQRPISHRIHMFLASLSIICKCGILGIGCVSIWCASGRGFLFHASATYRSL